MGGDWSGGLFSFPMSFAFNGDLAWRLWRLVRVKSLTRNKRVGWVAFGEQGLEKGRRERRENIGERADFAMHSSDLCVYSVDVYSVDSVIYLYRIYVLLLYLCFLW